MRIILSTLALAAAAAMPVAASAQAAEEVVTVRVGVADLDLTTSQGRAALEARLDAQLRKACRIDTRTRYALGQDMIDEKCVTEARSAALAEAERIAAADARSAREVAAN